MQVPKPRLQNLTRDQLRQLACFVRTIYSYCEDSLRNTKWLYG